MEWDLIEADVLVDGEEAVVNVLEDVRYLGFELVPADSLKVSS